MRMLNLCCNFHFNVIDQFIYAVFTPTSRRIKYSKSTFIRQKCSTMTIVIGIGNVSLTLENCWGQLGQEVNFVHVERQEFVLFLVVIIELSTNCVCI